MSNADTIVFGEKSGNRIMYADRNLRQMYTADGLRTLNEQLRRLGEEQDVITDDICQSKEAGSSHDVSDVALARNEDAIKVCVKKIADVEDYFIEN